MEILSKIDSIFNILLIPVLIISFLEMRKIKLQANDQKSLNKNEKVIVWITCLLAPFFAGLVYYFGLRKELPQKTKETNKIAWIAFIIMGVIWLTAQALVQTK